ncbi:MAG: gamma-glutamylcyclotransferase [Dehalococcoidia bacterium]|nr:MAG: gamma-glutamylcyclotransferase [Dehalococcoidia bacterium]
MYYFAYGLNLNRKRMMQYLSASRPMFSAELPNYKLLFCDWSRQWHGGLASLKHSRGDKVLGGIYEITETDLTKLDKHEWCPESYARLKVTVYRDSGEQIEAITYVKSGQPDETKPSNEYLGIIQQGYHDWGLI